MTRIKRILETYEMADEQGKLDMYMTYRDLREEFEDADIGYCVQEEEATASGEVETVKVKWNLCGRLIKALGV